MDHAPSTPAALETSGSLALKAKAAALSEAHEGSAAEDVLRVAIRDLFEGRLALVSSFGTEAAALLHLTSRIDPYLPVIFLDTHKHFPETLEYRRDLVGRLGLCNVQVVTPHPDAVRADDTDGTLHARAPDRCCHVRKTLPMVRALRGLSAWITGRKRAQAATRSALALFEAQDRRIKVNPLAGWDRGDVAAYFDAHDLPRHPLEARGYPSVGCAPCTARVAEGADPRSGRWANSEKTECGIHFENGRMVRRPG